MTVPQPYVICLFCLAGVVFCVWQVRRALRDGASEVEQILADADAHAAPLYGTGPGPDERPGSDAVVQDALERLYNPHAYRAPDPDLAAGCERLWNAIHDEQQKGDGP